MILGAVPDVLSWFPAELGDSIRDWLCQIWKETGPGRSTLGNLTCVLEEIDLHERAGKVPFWEGHREMVDLQFVLRGRERCGWAPREALVPDSRDDSRDLLVYPAPDYPLWLDLQPGLLVCFAPSDLHMPAMPGTGTTESVLRGVIKVPIGLLKRESRIWRGACAPQGSTS